jgi:hypothetical protein
VLTAPIDGSEPGVALGGVGEGIGDSEGVDHPHDATSDATETSAAKRRIVGFIIGVERLGMKRIADARGPSSPDLPMAGWARPSGPWPSSPAEPPASVPARTRC